MDSLDALPSADYASLLTISPLNNKGAIKEETEYTKENFDKSIHEHIYDQVTPIEPSQPSKNQSEQSKDDLEHRKFDKKGKKSAFNTYVLRNPSLSLSHANSAPDIRKPNKDLSIISSNGKYGSLNVTEANKKSISCSLDPTNDSSVFSISGRRVVVSHGFKGSCNRSDSMEVQGQISNQPSASPSIWSRSPSADSQIDAKRRRLQLCTDCFSLCLFVPGTLLCILSPWLLVPIYIIPNFSGGHLQTLIWIVCVGSTFLIFMGCMVGNMVWYRKGSKWKCLLHCGKGPQSHYWGDSLSSRTLHIV